MTREAHAARASHVRGAVAVRVVAGLVDRLAGGGTWHFAAFTGDEELILSLGCDAEPVDIEVLRAEVRQQRFSGALLPNVSTPHDAHLPTLDVIFGAFSRRAAILRITRVDKPSSFTPRDKARIERFFRDHSDAICAAIFELDDDDVDRLAARRAGPIAFTIDESGAVIASSSEETDDPQSVRAHLVPHGSNVPDVLREVIDDLLTRHRDGESIDLVTFLPFALVRLTPLHSQTILPQLLVTVEWLQRKISLEAGALRYAISKRELQVLTAMLRGASVMEMAEALSISESTVVFHLKRMLKKTQSKNRTELAARILGWNIPEPH